MEYVVVIVLVSLSILFIGRHFHKIANGESSCDCCDCNKECSSRKTDDCNCNHATGNEPDQNVRQKED